MQCFDPTLGLLALFAVVASSPSSFAGTHEVDDDGGHGVFTSLQAAIDAAAPGDVVLVHPGTYGGFDLAKPLSILGVEDPDLFEQTRVNGHVTVSGIPAGATATLSSLIVAGMVSLTDNAGPIVLDRLWSGTLRFARCDDVRAHRLWTLFGGSHRISDSIVEIVESELLGEGGDDCSCCNGGDGHAGAIVDGSSLVHLARTTVAGGAGGDVGCSAFAGGDGGAGLVIQPGAVVYVSGAGATVIRGGDGGLADDCSVDGAAGTGAWVAGGVLVHSEAQFLHGLSCKFEPPGLIVDSSGHASISLPSLPTMGFTGSAPAGSSTQFDLRGPAGAPALIAFGTGAVQIPFGAAPLGLLTSADAAVVVGQLDPASGVSTVPVDVPGAVPAGLAFPAQGAVFYPDGVLRLTNSVTLLVR